MKKVQYIGDTVNTLSRFGQVKKGDKLDLYEKEWDLICKDEVAAKSNYKIITKPVSKEERVIAEKIKPLGTPRFDLRSVPWEHSKIINILESRVSKLRLVKMVGAINDIGGVISKSSVHDTRAMLVDRIVEGARLMGWTKLSKVERLALPKWDGTETKKESSGNAKPSKKELDTKKTSSNKPKTKALRSRRVSAA